MGNSSISKKVSSIKKKITKDNTQLEADKQCPTCLLFFAANIPEETFNEHVEKCLQAADGSVGSESSDPQLQQYIVKKEQQLDNYFYEKVPCDPSRTRFKWHKTACLQVGNEVMGLKVDAVRKLPFQNKLSWFRHNLQKRRIPWMNGADFMCIEKDNVLMSSVNQLSKVNLYKQVKIEFAGDKVNDAGGLLREWMHLVIKEIFDQSSGIFLNCNTEEIMYKLKWDECLDEEFSEELLTLFGSILGKAIFEKIPVLCYLSRTILRQIVQNGGVCLQDIYAFDVELYRSWSFLLSNQIDTMNLQIYFVLTKQQDDLTLDTIQLVDNGSTVLVTDSNKKLFVDMSIQTLSIEKVSRSIKAIRKGLFKVVPEELLSVFEPYELEMILYGAPFISVEDWKNDTIYKGKYSEAHKVVVWFWEVVRQFDQQMLARLLQFCTGSSRIPIHGFKKMESNRGNAGCFVIESSNYNKGNPYPKGHTCFNRLQLPEYPNKKTLQIYVRAVATQELDGIFGLD